MQLTYHDLIWVFLKGNHSRFQTERENKLNKLDGVLRRGVCLQLLRSWTFISVGALGVRFQVLL